MNHKNVRKRRKTSTKHKQKSNTKAIETGERKKQSKKEEKTDKPRDKI